MPLCGEAQSLWCGVLALNGERKGVSVVGGTTLELSNMNDGSVAVGNRVDLRRVAEVAYPKGEGFMALDLVDPPQRLVLRGDDENITKLMDALEKEWKNGDVCERTEWGFSNHTQTPVALQQTVTANNNNVNNASGNLNVSGAATYNTSSIRSGISMGRQGPTPPQAQPTEPQLFVPDAVPVGAGGASQESMGAVYAQSWPRVDGSGNQGNPSAQMFLDEPALGRRVSSYVRGANDGAAVPMSDGSMGIARVTSCVTSSGHGMQGGARRQQHANHTIHPSHAYGGDRGHEPAQSHRRSDAAAEGSRRRRRRRGGGDGGAEDSPRGRVRSRSRSSSPRQESGSASRRRRRRREGDRQDHAPQVHRRVSDEDGGDNDHSRPTPRHDSPRPHPRVDRGGGRSSGRSRRGHDQHDDDDDYRRVASVYREGGVGSTSTPSPSPAGPPQREEPAAVPAMAVPEGDRGRDGTAPPPTRARHKRGIPPPLTLDVGGVQCGDTDAADRQQHHGNPAVAAANSAGDAPLPAAAANASESDLRRHSSVLRIATKGGSGPLGVHVHTTSARDIRTPPVQGLEDGAGDDNADTSHASVLGGDRRGSSSASPHRGRNRDRPASDDNDRHHRLSPRLATRGASSRRNAHRTGSRQRLTARSPRHHHASGSSVDDSDAMSIRARRRQYSPRTSGGDGFLRGGLQALTLGDDVAVTPVQAWPAGGTAGPQEDDGDGSASACAPLPPAVPSLPPYLPTASAEAWRGFTEVLARHRARCHAHAGGAAFARDPWANPVRLLTLDSDFWAFFQLTARNAPEARVPPFYCLTPGGRAEVNSVPDAGAPAGAPAAVFGRTHPSTAETAAPRMRVSAAFFDAYVDGWRRMHPCQITIHAVPASTSRDHPLQKHQSQRSLKEVDAALAGAPLAAFAAPAKFWQYATRNMRPSSGWGGGGGGPHVRYTSTSPGDYSAGDLSGGLVVRVKSGRDGPNAVMTTTRASWNELCAMWEDDKGLHAAGRRALLTRGDARPHVTLMLPPPRARGDAVGVPQATPPPPPPPPPAPAATRSPREDYWSAFLSEWDAVAALQARRV